MGAPQRLAFPACAPSRGGWPSSPSPPAPVPPAARPNPGVAGCARRPRPDRESCASGPRNSGLLVGRAAGCDGRSRAFGWGRRWRSSQAPRTAKRAQLRTIGRDKPALSTAQGMRPARLGRPVVCSQAGTNLVVPAGQEIACYELCIGPASFLDGFPPPLPWSRDPVQFGTEMAGAVIPRRRQTSPSSALLPVAAAAARSWSIPAPEGLTSREVP